MAEKWQRTIPASQRKRQKAKTKGQFPKSGEISIAVALAMLLAGLGLLGPRFVQGLSAFLEQSITNVSTRPITDVEGTRLVRAAFIRVLEVTGPIAGMFVLGAFVVGVYQTGGFSVSMERVRIDISRFNPIKGVKKIISKDGLVKLAVGLSKITTIAVVLYITIRPRISQILLLGQQEIEQIMPFGVHIFFLIILRVTIALFVIAFIDKKWQRHRHEENLKMTKEEHKEEMKSVEGNPKMKRKILEAQRKILLQQMYQDTEQADVVVTNPTHFAVALKYQPGEMGAPKVVAKGMNLVAERIRKIARENDIPVIENKPLARTLYQMCMVGMEIPEKLFRPVAELLAYVFKMRERRRAARGNAE